MLHPILLAGRPATQMNSDADLCPLHFEQDVGVQSRYAAILQSLSGDVFDAPTVVTSLDCADLARDQSGDIALRNLILEPADHKPAAALLAALMTLKHKPNALVVIAHASADLADASQLDSALCHALPAAQRGEIVLLGQRASRVDSGHGQLEIGSIPRDGTPVAVQRVLSSGRLTSLSGLFQTSHHLQGLGVYVARVDTLLAAYKRHANRLFVTIKSALNTASASKNVLRLSLASYQRLKPLSFERAIGGKADNIVAVQTDCDWSALHEWDQDSRADADLVASVDAWDADLAADSAMFGPTSSRAAQMLALLDRLDSSDKTQAPRGRSFETEQFDWGSREALAIGDGFALQRLVVAPGQSIDVTAGADAAEHWIIVKGSALLMVSDQMKLLWQNQSARVPAGRSRRIENPGSEPLQMVQLRVAARDTQRSTALAQAVPPIGVA